MDEGLFHFDDDMFDISVPHNLIHKLEYPESVTFQPRISKWFLSAPCQPSEKDNFGMITKFKADLAYRESRYEEAIQFYKQFQEHIKDVNNLLWRSSEEDIGRCYLKLNQFEEALNCAHNLESTASNIDHYTCLSNFMVNIYETSRLSNHDKMVHLMKLLLIHPGHSSSWFKLGQCVLDSQQSVFPTISKFSKGPERQAMTCFTICFLLEKRRTCHPFVREVSERLMEKALSHLERICKDKDKLESFVAVVDEFIH